LTSGFDRGSRFHRTQNGADDTDLFDARSNESPRAQRNLPTFKKRVQRKPSALAELMAEVRHTRQSVSPDEGRQAARRQRLTVGEERGRRGGTGRGEGGGVRPLSRRSFLAAYDQASPPSSPPREDSPLLGTSGGPSRSLATRAFAEEDEKREAGVDCGDLEGERAASAAAAAVTQHVFFLKATLSAKPGGRNAI